MIATLLFSQGVPMLLAGDELGHSQAGNNNAYCQDNEISWLDQDLDERRRELLRFVGRAMKIFHEQPVFHRRRFFHGRAIEGTGAPEIAWMNVDGFEMSSEVWNYGFVKCLGVLLFGDSIDIDEHGEEIRGDTLLLLFNAAHGHPIPVILPQLDEPEPWELLLDTADPNAGSAILIRSTVAVPDREPFARW